MIKLIDILAVMKSPQEVSIRVGDGEWYSMYARYAIQIMDNETLNQKASFINFRSKTVFIYLEKLGQKENEQLEKM